MANTIRLYENSPIDDWLTMSNGATEVFISVLGLSGSRIAKTDDEKMLIVWILEHDQSAIGIGAAGFDLSELPWNKRRFNLQKKFMLEVLEGIENKLSWEVLEYIPNEKLLKIAALYFRKMLQQVNESIIDEKAMIEWIADSKKEEPMKNGFPLCKRHKIFLTVFGCHICNNYK